MLRFRNHIVAIVILMIITTVINVYIPLAEKELLDNGLMNKNFSKIIYYLIIIFVVKFLHELISSIQDYISTYISNKFTYNITRDAFKKLLRFPLTFFQIYNIGQIASRINGDIGSISILVDSQIIELCTSLLTLFGIIIIMARLNIIMFLISCFAIPIIVITNGKIAEQQKKTSKKIREQYDIRNKCLQEMILGIKEVKYLNIFKWAEREFVHVQNNIFRERMRINKIVLVLFMISSRLYEIVYTGVYLAGAYILVKGNFTVGELFAFLAYFNRAISIVERLTRFNGSFQTSLVSMERVYEIIEYKQENSKTKTSENNNYTIDVTDELNEKTKISFENVCFSYDDSKEILKNINFDILPGEKVALIGENGSGKSTILSLLMKFIKPNRGTISCDGDNISKMDLSELINKISYIPQSPFMFNYSIRENILLGNKKVTDDKIYKILGQVGLQDFVSNLEKGLDTKLTLSGSNVSGGQFQRLAIARALLRDCEILLLDESTSNIEEQFEEEFIEDMFSNHKELTVIMIIHKYRLLQHFDKIMYVNSGNVLVTTPKDFEESNTKKSSAAI
ncbi:ABC transporter ATP-binding protein [Abyssisolibacter fermentans]|uniref:ABC transporter ATP-binding protein n=1 Tax=Abyssisolibacter fermentans TaxID=1766203 RepID=UPI0012E3B2B7|nr:ABC transporter ATP-binding protein [Abyssisolibacter fermentans]